MLPASESEVVQLQCGRCRWVVLWPWPTHETCICRALAVLCSGWQQQGMLLAQRDALRHLLRTGRPGELHIPLGRGGSSVWFPHKKKFLLLSCYVSLNWNWELHLLFQFLLRTNDTNQPQNLTLWEEPKTVQGQVKDCLCFQVLTRLWCLSQEHLLYFDVCSQAGVSAAFLYSCGCQGMWASCKDSIIFILPSTSSFFGSLLQISSSFFSGGL